MSLGLFIFPSTFLKSDTLFHSIQIQTREIWSDNFSVSSLISHFPPPPQRKATDGVVVATEKKLPPLMDETSLQKISMLTESIGVVYAGMGPDSRVLVRKGRKIAQQYYRMYHAQIPVNQIVRDLAAIMQEFTQSGYIYNKTILFPFFAALLLEEVAH